ncbi:MAG: hypothetical protein GEV05_22955 [Betaproteobacteria bacterium]|nr:hypothetical protein [Betaproteobacteria bacterium]
MKVYSYLRTLIASLLLAACTTVGVEKPPPAIAPQPAPPVAEPAPPVEVAPTPPPVAIPEAPAALRALRFYAALKERPAREQRQEQERLRKSFAASRSDYDRIRLALAFSMPGVSAAEESQALELLEPLVRDLRSDYHELALLASTLLAEQRRRGEQAAALQRKLERIKALEKEMQERSTARELRSR